MRIASILVFFIISFSLSANDLSTAKPSDLGFDAERLKRVEKLVQGYIDQGQLAGATTLIARKGKIVHEQKYGLQDLSTGQEMRDDSIFRIYSMTKPVTSVALMMLYEEGRFRLNDPVEWYIPQFKDLPVFVGVNDDGSLKTEPQKKKMTIRDLMRHTAGFTYGIFSDTPVDKLYRKKGDLSDKTNAELVESLKDVPLLFQPGTRWHYSLSVDIQGHLIEILSGMTLDRFFQERIFKPLGMKDTGFFVPNAKANRFAALYTRDQDGKLITVPPGSPLSLKQTEDDKPIFLSGGGGLVSTTRDYYRFSQMLLNRGSFNGARLLAPKTLDLMTMDHSVVQGIDMANLADQGYGFGLNFAVMLDPSKPSSTASIGEYNWGGAASTIFWVDPKEELVVVFMTQLMVPVPKTFRDDLRIAVYQALIE